MTVDPRLQGWARLAAGLAALVLLLGAFVAVLVADITRTLNCDETPPLMCDHQELAQVQLALAWCGLVPAVWTLVAALRGRAEQAGLAALVAVALYLTWGVLLKYL